jgi:hypothetical protein
MSYAISPNLQLVLDSYKSLKRDEPSLFAEINTIFLFSFITFLSARHDFMFVINFWIGFSIFVELASVAVLHTLTEPKRIERSVPTMNPQNLPKMLKRTMITGRTTAVYLITISICVAILSFYDYGLTAASMVFVALFSTYYTWYYQVKMKDLVEAARFVKEDL